MKYRHDVHGRPGSVNLTDFAGVEELAEMIGD